MMILTNGLMYFTYVNIVYADMHNLELHPSLILWLLHWVVPPNKKTLNSKIKGPINLELELRIALSKYCCWRSSYPHLNLFISVLSLVQEGSIWNGFYFLIIFNQPTILNAGESSIEHPYMSTYVSTILFLKYVRFSIINLIPSHSLPLMNKHKPELIKLLFTNGLKSNKIMHFKIIKLECHR